jgi:MoaA/NifB/PqqE/SkfB family radical SAM enzyme
LTATRQGEPERLLIGIEPTRHCNLRCIHCLRADTFTKEEIPLALFTRILDEARVYGRPHIALTGGEPTLHKHFTSLLGAIQERGYTCHFVSNGKNFADLIGGLGPYRTALQSVSFSVDGATEETHDTIRGKGSFRLVCLAIAIARYKGLWVTVQIVVNRQNRHELQAMPQLCKDLGAQTLFFCHSQPTADLYQAKLQLTPDEWLEVEQETRELAQTTSGVPPRIAAGMYDPGTVAPCSALQHRSLNIDFRGRLTLCCQLSGVGDDTNREDVIADLNQVSLAEAHRLLLARIQEVLGERLAGIATGAFGELDKFQCWFCQKRFKKLDWMRQHPDDAWVARDPYLRALPA